jgi:hypothetical protein
MRHRLTARGDVARHNARVAVVATRIFASARIAHVARETRDARARRVERRARRGTRAKRRA